MNNQIVIGIIDDDTIYQFIAKKMIEKINVAKKILVFSDGEEAINFLINNISNSTELPDIIFLDINMPIMDGWGFMEEFIKLNPKPDKKINIYMVSSSVDPVDIERARKTNEVSDYLIKPITTDKIKTIVDAVSNLGLN